MKKVVLIGCGKKNLILEILKNSQQKNEKVLGKIVKPQDEEKIIKISTETIIKTAEKVFLD